MSGRRSAAPPLIRSSALRAVPARFSHLRPSPPLWLNRFLVSAFLLLRRLLVATSLLLATPFVARAQARPASPDPRDSIDVASLTFDGAKEVSATDLKTVLFTR